MSPDGNKIVFYSWRDGVKINLFIANRDGSGKKNLMNETFGELLGDCSASWSPDGKSLVFSSDNEIYTINADGSNLKHIVEKVKVLNRGMLSSEGCPIWSK